jgi:hypothetical protein
MKYSEIAQIKETIMKTLEKSVDNMLDQVQADEFNQVLEEDDRVNKIRAKGDNVSKQIIDLRPGYFDACIVIDFPKHIGSNGEGYIVFSNPTVPLRNHFLNEKCQNYSHAMMSEKLRQIRENKTDK